MQTLTLEILLFVTAILLLLSVLAGKVTGPLGIPSLLVFLGVGMLAGSDGPGGIYFDDARAAQWLGVTALIFILFSGGMDTDWPDVRSWLGPGLALSTVGVVVTTGLVGAMAHQVLGFPVLEALLLGAIISSTDAAAVFGLLRAKSIPMPENVRALLELESGSNDPVAVFLTVGLLGLLTGQVNDPVELLPQFVVQMTLGALLGFLIGRGGVLIMRRLTLEFDALFHVVSIVVVLLAYSGATLAGGNGFLAVYVAGLTYGNGSFRQRRGLRKFHEGIAWLFQIAMFLVLGLLVFPSQLPAVAWQGMAIASFLMLVARPVGVALCLAPFRLPGRVVVLVGWTGLRGAVPIILATFPLLAGLPKAQEIFNIVFFVVLISSIAQGTTLTWLARKLGFAQEPAKTGS